MITPPTDEADRFGRDLSHAQTTWARVVVAWLDRTTGEVCGAAWEPWPFLASMYFACSLDVGSMAFGRITRVELAGFDCRCYRVREGLGVVHSWSYDGISVAPLGIDLYRIHRDRIGVDAYAAHARRHRVDTFALVRSARMQAEVQPAGERDPLPLQNSLFTP